MNRRKAASGLRAGGWILLVALAAAAPARAQGQSVDTSQPIAIRPAPKTKIKYATFSGQIVSVNKQAIRVRAGNSYDVRTFAYTPKVSAKIAKGLAKGRYGSGQVVEIKYAPGSDVASRIKR